MKKSPWTEATGAKNRQRSDAADEQEDPLNPAIPRAPLVPHDIARMPNAALPVWSHPPDERGGERPTLSATDSRDHVDARPPPGATPSTYQSAAMPPHTESLPRMRPVVIGKASLPAAPLPDEGPTTPGSPRPTALERHSPQPAPAGGAGGARWTIVWIVLVAVALLAGVWFSGVLN